MSDVQEVTGTITDQEPNAIMAVVNQEHVDQEKILAAERAKDEAVRIEAEKKAAQERAEADAKLKAEREAREKLEREAKEKSDAERVAKEQAERAEREQLLAIEQAEKQAKAAPDKEKAIKWTRDSWEFISHVPTVADERIARDMDFVAKYIAQILDSFRLKMGE